MSKYGEPWSISEDFAVLDSNGKWLGRVDECRNRAVACVNACEGIDDPAKLRAQRDALLEAVRYALPGAWHESCLRNAPGEDPDPTWHCCDWTEAVELFRAALTLCEEGKS